MTSISETASATLDLTALFSWPYPVGPSAATTANPTPLAGIPWELLLQLDKSGWAQIFADNDVNQDFTLRLDRLVATWLTQEDYREIREIASSKTGLAATEAAEAIFSDWIDGGTCKRLSHLVLGMRFNEPKIPICYALCSAERAIHSAVRYSKKPQGLTQEAIAAAKVELDESSEEYVALASLGILYEPPEGAI